MPGIILPRKAVGEIRKLTDGTDGKIKVIFTQGDFVSYTWPDLIFQASQMAKATFFKGFSVYGLLAMMILYTVAIIAALKLL